MPLAASAAPGSAEYYARPYAQRVRAWAAVARSGRPVKIEDYFNEPERQALSVFFGGGEQAAVDDGGLAAAMAAAFAGSGSGGTTIIQAPQMSPQPQLPRNVDEARTYIRQHYGMYSFLLDDPSVGPTLERAAMEGWPDDRVQAELQNTDWWKNSTASSRQWDALNQTDPGEAGRLFGKATQQAKLLFRHYGLPIEGNQRVLEMAVNIVRQGWGEDEVRRAIVSELQWDAASGVPNPLGDTTVQVMSAAADFAVPLSEQAGFTWARQIEMGDVDPGMVEDQFREQAQLNFPFWNSQIAAGQTVKQLASPHIQTYAQLLETSPEAVNLLDPNFQRLIKGTDEKGNVRPLALWETQKTIMADPVFAWDKTNNARETATGLVEQLQKTFGYG